MASTVSDTAAVAIQGKTSDRKERVVILGSGWAGYAFARTLDPRKYERFMISPRSYFVFTPLVAGTAAGTLEFRAVIESVRRLNLDHFYQGWADDVDFERKVVRVEANTSDDVAGRTRAQLAPAPGKLEIEKGPMFDVQYDKLVIAVGAYAQTFGIEGVKEYANFLRNVGDARRVRIKILQCFEKASLPITTDEEKRKLLHFAVVGGGPTGIEFAAELHDLIEDDLRKTYPDLYQFIKITVYDVAPKVLPMFDQKLAQYAMDTFKRGRIDVKTEHHLTRIRPDDDCAGCLKLRFKEYGDEEVGAGIVVWSTGLMQNPLIQKLESKEEGLQLQKDAKTGGLVSDAHLRVLAAPKSAAGKSEQQQQDVAVVPNVYSIGDCAVVTGQRYPATAQVASQQATYLARSFNKGNLEAKPFRFRNWGVMTYLGSWKAIHQSSADELTGRAAWFLWRTAYLTKSMSIRNKIMVPVYWLISWVFGRDISRF
ncbi:pyridine nucleotide-disulfide oxidoreductase-domain-containing protein [Xylaria bambusicola]|uniref:pyridine nucleotide-disulfide oxidoreductase-domain-containing protein n=1 Tax=Xylaria bambusicola TaxID=326684 RepID=UPI002008A93B|nr:pyridine nucleotide-disulfide oxidoreductase-domain-containing protein [Xylaria bambusicola]KAI0526338.1 pyridine nucleotide-disulfide oxidoreductase-domain-containing protein [Xylaria bambusicola]